MKRAKKIARRGKDAPGLAARRFAADALFAVLLKNRTVEEVLERGEIAEALNALEERDRALTRMILMTALRRLGSLRAIIEGFLEGGWPDDHRVQTILLVGATQILFLDVPDHAAVDLSVRLASEIRNARYTGLTNAVLRSVAAEGKARLEALDPEIETPEWLRVRWRATYGDEMLRAISEAHRIEPALDITPKSDADVLAQQIGGLVLSTGSVRVTGKGALAQLPGYEDGNWWVQDAAATIPATLLGDVRGKRVADLCAAPGGKTLQLANAGANVVAVDRSAPRLKRLEQNLARTKLRAEIICADAATWQSDPFDAILLDAPCSATGTIRRHPDILWQKKPEDLVALTKLQTRLLAHAATMLKPGGVLVYSTCSLEPEEGEQQVDSFLSASPAFERVAVASDEAGDSRAVTPAGNLRTLPFHFPHDDPRLSGCDGFFAARLRRIH